MLVVRKHARVPSMVDIYWTFIGHTLDIHWTYIGHYIGHWETQGFARLKKVTMFLM